MKSKEKDYLNEQCPVCGYYCLGKGGIGCIDKPFLVKSSKTKETKVDWEKIFFDRLADKLDKIFPKGKCQERGKAIVLNAYANIIFRELLTRISKESYQKSKEETIKEMEKCFVISKWNGEQTYLLSKKRYDKLVKKIK